MGLAPITTPQTEPIGIEEAKLYLRVTADQENSLIVSCISAARDAIERHFGQSFRLRQWRYTLDKFPSNFSWYWALTYPQHNEDKVIELPQPPLVSVDSVQYLSNGSYTTLSTSAYRVDLTSVPGVIYPAPGTQFPLADNEPEAVVITFTGGYTTFDAVPMARLLMLKALAYFYENRGIVSDGDIDEMFNRLCGLGDFIPVI